MLNHRSFYKSQLCKYFMKQKENKSFFLMQFGDIPQLRVLDFLIGFHFFDYPMTEIAKESNVSYNSIKIFFPQFIKKKKKNKKKKKKKKKKIFFFFFFFKFLKNTKFL